MEINPEEEINKRAEKVTRDDVGETVGKERETSKRVKDSNILKRYWEDVKTAFSLLRDWYKGDYNDVPFRMVSAITAALIYLISPLDVVPDCIPLAGLVDDALVLAAVFALSRRDLDAYSKWVNSKLGTVHN